MNLVQSALPLSSNTQAPDAARVKDVARQLEGQFAQMMIKCMREASFGDSLFPGENQTFRDMYDQQMAKALSQGRGLGLAPMIERQLAGNRTDAVIPVNTALSQYRQLLPGAGDAGSMLDAIAGRSLQSTRADASAATADLPLPLSAALRSHGLQPYASETDEDAACDNIEQIASQPPARFAAHSPERFVADIWAHAKDAARELGVDPRALVAQAALETGWGKRGIQRNEGGSSHNLFGIKATGWNGDRTRTTTHEYNNGVRQTETASFRAYGSAAESFADYVRLLKSNPRYQQALAAGTDIRGFAAGLQKAGYATDPSYAAKISAIAHGPTLGKVLSVIGNGAGAVARAAVDTLLPAR
ncbi:flagellar assembly peptidoglycan hydrolase FlgJ [Pseudoxanthomonas dokdonensis]|uniref:Peptidoglycan hydrolase FlgJ n=1 Tax=Pseudoxanthomonas dokdonensis TaxID=344882 RepID=A0A0R0CYR2_9GAMM|nr:flagellar assembly peptidoglycan hydrolase FlgJ [Pseudoxanthomonas dokdonensis]KRG71009.1 hypothetical protein ABB29_04075 [Pseudoxanthomonas dokdonensis]